MGGVRYRFHNDCNAHWRGWVARGLLFGLAAATVVAATAAARRTGSSYDRFVAVIPGRLAARTRLATVLRAGVTS